MSLGSEEDNSNNSSSNQNESGNGAPFRNYEICDEEILDQYDIYEYEKFNDEMKIRLETICINLPFIPSPTHMCETWISRPPTDSVKKLIDQFGVEMKVGIFNPAEDKIIKKNWESFAKDYKFDDPSLFFSIKYIKLEERIKLAQYLGHNLPHRYLYSILMRFKNLYKYKISGKFDKQTDEVLLKHINEHKVLNFLQLSKILNRDKHSIYRRCLILKQMQDIPVESIKWNYEIIEKLLRSLLNVCNIDDITVLKNKTIIFHTWLEIEKDCGIPAIRAKKFWLRKLHTQLFSVNYVTRNNISIKLIEIFFQRKYRYRQDVNWSEILGYFDDDGLTTLFLCKRWHSLVRKFVPKEIRHKLRKTVKFLKTCEPRIKKSNDWALEKLIFKKREGLKSIEVTEQLQAMEKY